MSRPATAPIDGKTCRFSEGIPKGDALVFQCGDGVCLPALRVLILFNGWGAACLHYLVTSYRLPPGGTVSSSIKLRDPNPIAGIFNISFEIYFSADVE